MIKEIKNFEDYLLPKCPASAYYIPDFISVDEEDELCANIYDAPKPKWTNLKNRRLQNWGGLPQPKGMLLEEMPSWLDEHCAHLSQMGVFKIDDEKTLVVPNHCLVNEYEPGQGIMPHEDGPMYAPTVATISLGSYTLLDFYRPVIDDATDANNNQEERFIFSLLLEPRSLVILKDDMYSVYMHGIKEVTHDKTTLGKIYNYAQLKDIDYKQETTECIRERGKRVSVTIRYVPKFKKLNINSLLFKK